MLKVGEGFIAEYSTFRIEGINFIKWPTKRKGIYGETINPLIYMVPRTGIEPVRGYPRGILSPLRLPIPPPRLSLVY